jgi:histidinol-phosphatase (PHP family)
MITADLHMHTTYCDGKNTPEEMILSAIDKGLKTVGLSGHCYTGNDKVFGMSKDNMQKYFDEIQALKIKYKDKIEVLCGIEQDSFAGFPALDFDYAIGSVHYVYKNGNYLGVDHSEQILVNDVKKFYNGDFYAYAEDYYSQVANVLKDTNADIIGHFDLVTKFNEGYKLFDETHPRYVSAFKKAVDALIPYNKPFEINSGAISRGYRTKPYPSLQILEYIKEKGGRVILSSDSHSAQNIAYNYDQSFEIYKKVYN